MGGDQYVVGVEEPTTARAMIKTTYSAVMIPPTITAPNASPRPFSPRDFTCDSATKPKMKPISGARNARTSDTIASVLVRGAAE